MKKLSEASAALEALEKEAELLRVRPPKPHALRDRLRLIRRQNPNLRDKAAAGLLQISKQLDKFAPPVTTVRRIAKSLPIPEEPVAASTWLERATRMALEHGAVVASRGLKLLSKWLAQ